MRGSIIIFLLTLCLPPTAEGQARNDLYEPLKKLQNGGLLIDDFEDDEVGSLPGGWWNRDVKRRADHPEESLLYHYSVQEEENGNKYLYYNHTDARHLNLPLKERDNINIYKTPILSWRWKVDQIPEGADETSKDTNDAAASIYVVFDMGRVALFKRVPKSIRYTWSSTLKKGSDHSIFFGNQKIVVLESGEEKVGKGWIKVKRNIVDDYRRLFGDDPPGTPLAILILSDGDSTHQPAIASYDDLMLLPDLSPGQ